MSINTWYEVDVTSLVTGDGTYSLRISDSIGGADYSSKEGANAPQLVLTLGGTPASTNTPTQTPTSGPSPTPTNTSTPTLVPSPTPTAPAAFNSATFVYDGDGRRVKSTINGVTTTFIGSHYEVTNGVVTKYYYAGSQRIAMRINGTLNYLLGDHLGSTSLTTNASGQVISELRYKAWGEERYASGTTPTKYQYTGQFSYTSDFGLYFYNARWYDPALGRFAQADSIIPESTQGVQAWDRYAYANNSPVRYSDPTGHCIICSFASFVATSFVQPLVSTALGHRPDVEGVLTTMAFTNTDNAVVAAGLAVQSEYPLAIVWGDGRGLAQVTSEEMKSYGLEGENPYLPSVAVTAMEKRIELATNACHKCQNPTDMLIVAALSQNGSGFDAASVADLPMNNGAIDWKSVMTEQGGNPSAWYARLRQNGAGMNFDTQFMLKIFTQDLKMLMKLGYRLPSEYEGADFDYIDDLIRLPNRKPSH